MINLALAALQIGPPVFHLPQLSSSSSSSLLQLLQFMAAYLLSLLVYFPVSSSPISYAYQWNWQFSLSFLWFIFTWIPSISKQRATLTSQHIRSLFVGVSVKGFQFLLPLSGIKKTNTWLFLIKFVKDINFNQTLWGVIFELIIKYVIKKKREKGFCLPENSYTFPPHWDEKEL